MAAVQRMSHWADCPWHIPPQQRDSSQAEKQTRAISLLQILSRTVLHVCDCKCFVRSPKLSENVDFPAAAAIYDTSVSSLLSEVMSLDSI